jgi:metallo-beta-lactamase family protein
MISIYGDSIPVKAKIYSIEGLSAHADQVELIEWAAGFTNKPKVAFVIHGEGKASETLASKLKEEFGWNTIVPNYLESVLLFDGI